MRKRREKRLNTCSQAAADRELCAAARCCCAIGGVDGSLQTVLHCKTTARVDEAPPEVLAIDRADLSSLRLRLVSDAIVWLSRCLKNVK